MLRWKGKGGDHGGHGTGRRGYAPTMKKRVLHGWLSGGVVATVVLSHGVAQEPVAEPTDAPAPRAGQPPLPFDVRRGYEVTPAAWQIKGPRMMAFGEDGTLFVSVPRPGEILALRDTDGDGVYDARSTFAREIPSVHAMSWHKGWLYFATTGAVFKTRDVDGNGAGDERLDVIAPGNLPQGGVHWWRSLLVTDDHIFTSIGDSGNITDEGETPRQKIWRFDLDGSNRTLFASGVRNTEELLIRPGTNELWGVDHGSDNFGQSLGEQTGTKQPVTDWNPPDEFNRYVEGGFYGHPFITGYALPRYEFRQRRDLMDLAEKNVPPEWAFPAHGAANAFCFIDPALNAKTGAFPPDHAGDAFVALRGSWNRVEKAGYEVVRVLFDPQTGKPYGMLRIVSTLSKEGDVLARPVDCVQAPDGTVLFSCDHSNAIFRVRWVGDER